MQYAPLKLMVALGKYDESALEKMLNPDIYKTEYLYSAREAMKK